MADPVHVKGLAELQRTLAELPSRIQEKVLVGATSAGAKVLQDEMTARAPVRQDGELKKLGRNSTKARLPGFLKASIGRKRTDRRSGTQVSYAVGVLGRAFYAIFYEFGSRHQTARPFIRPAAEAKQDAAVEAMAAKLRAGIESGRDLGLRS